MRSPWLVCVLISLAALAESGCRGYRAAQQQRAAEQSDLQQIIVIAGGLNGPYRTLGPVDYPGDGWAVLSLVGPAPCIPDKARKAAVEQYGHVDAIIGFNYGSTPYCGGTAVAFTAQ